MSEETKVEDVNTEDRVTADHDAGIGSSADEMETHNPDMDDFDQVVKDMEADEDESEDTSGGTVNTDDSEEETAAEGKDEVEEDARIPKSRLDEVIAERNQLRDEKLNREVEWARERAIFEGRLAALENVATPESEAVKDPFDDVLEGEPQAILDAFQEDPAGFIRAIQGQAKAATAAEIAERQAEERYQMALKTELDKFTAEHDDFIPNANKLVEIMDSNPMHNVISAYAYEIEIPALKAQIEEANKGVEDKIAAARSEGIAEGKKQAIKEFQAKGGAAVLDGSAAKQTGGQANVGIQTGGDGQKLRAEITKNLLKKRAAG